MPVAGQLSPALLFILSYPKIYRNSMRCFLLSQDLKFNGIMGNLLLRIIDVSWIQRIRYSLCLNGWPPLPQDHVKHIGRCKQIHYSAHFGHHRCT